MFLENEKMTVELDQRRKLNVDDNRQIVFLKSKVETLENENEELSIDIETLRMELIQSDLFAKAGLAQEYGTIKRKHETTDGRATITEPTSARLQAESGLPGASL